MYGVFVQWVTYLGGKMTEAEKNEIRQQTLLLLYKRDKAQGEERKKIISEITSINLTYIEGYIVKRYASQGTEVIQELMSECTIAFMRAIDTYIIDDNSLYSTYANFFMTSAISDYFRKTKGIKKSILNNMRALKNCIKKLEIKYEDSVNHIPQLAAELKWGEQRVRDTLYYLSLEYVHMDFYDLHDELFPESEYVMDEVVISDVTSDEIRNIVKNAISPRKLAILDARYDMGFFPEIQELKKTMTATDALNLYLGENRTCKYYCSMVTYILKELGRNKKLEKIFIC